MKWATPSYVVIKMDAEIGSYQVDPELPDGLVTPAPRPAPGAANDEVREVEVFGPTRFVRW